jgi:Uma2 family endonuclease
MRAILQTKRAPVLGPELNGTLMTPEEFDAVEASDDNYVYELIHGVLIVNPIPSETEVGPNEYLGHLRLAYRERDLQKSPLNATLPERYIRTKGSRRRADRVIWAGLSRLPDWKKDLPNIAVEFVSRARRDRLRDYEEKQREYMELGVDEYWIIARFRRIMTVVRKGPKGPQVRIVHEQETYSTPLLPGFESPLARLLEIADRFEQPLERGARSAKRGAWSAKRGAQSGKKEIVG